jgi:hypothetical protein
MILTMAQLKNCSLGGVRDRPGGKETTNPSQSSLILCLPFPVINRLGLSIDISLPIIIDLINSFTGMYVLRTT